MIDRNGARIKCLRCEQPQTHHHQQVKLRPHANICCSKKPLIRNPRLFLLFGLITGQMQMFSVALGLLQLPNRHTIAFIPGDLVIGSLIPIHERPEPKQAQTRTCGAVREQYGIQRVEAAFRTIDSINADPTILPNITLGIEIRDTCWHSPIALEQSIEFIRDAMVANEQSHMRQQQQQQVNAAGSNLQQGLAQENGGGQRSDNSTAVCAPLLLRQQQQLAAAASGQPKKVKNIVGVVGPASSGDTVQVQNLLQMFNMPQVGYSATSRDLSNKNFFKYFLRVVPSDKLQARVLIDLMLAHNWTYVTVVYTEGSYGSSLMNAFRERAQEVGICFATLESMPPNADDAKFDELIEAIKKHSNARVVICMCEGRTVMKLFSGFKRRNIINEYLVVGSDGWADRFDVVEKQEEYALGGISIRIHSAYVNDFDNYYFSLSPYTNQRNPWFAEFWESRFQCNLNMNNPPVNGEQVANGGANFANSSSSSSSSTSSRQSRPLARTPNGGSKPQLYSRNCTGRESLRNNHAQDAKMAFVQKSIILMALGLDSMQRVICPANKPGLCPEMLPVNGSTLIQHLMNVRFSFLGEEVYFDEQGDPPGKYEILNFRRRRRPPVPSDTSVSFAHDGATEEDYSVASAALNSSGGGNSWRLATDRKRPSPHQDSYSSLKVYRNANPTRVQRRSSGTKGTAEKLDRITSGQTPLEARNSYASTSGYEYVHVGSWKSSDGLSLFDDINWPGAWPSDGSAVPQSVCSLPCAKGHAKKIQSDSVKCCWVCVPCRPNEYLFDEFNCTACDKGWWPNSQQTGCDQIPIKHLDWRSMEAISAMSIAFFGLLLTLATAIVFIRHNETPVVKSTTRELSYMILFAMLLCYLNTFFLVAKPRKETCFVTRILPGFAFAMMYGALVTKTNRIARILAGSKKKIITRRPRFMSATSQVAITWIIVLIECIIIVFMLIREPADKMLYYPSDQRVLLVCNTTTMGIIAPLGFDFFLIAMCTLYAFKTRNVPENFNEAKFIGFTMYTTLVIWVAFVAIYLSSDHKVTTLSLCISFSALFALFLLFFPRCYIIIFKPEKNNRSFFTTTKNVRCHIGYPAGSTAAATAAAAAAAAATVAAGAQGSDSVDSYGGGGQQATLTDQWDSTAAAAYSIYGPASTSQNNAAVASCAGSSNSNNTKRGSGLLQHLKHEHRRQQRVGDQFGQRASQLSMHSYQSDNLALVSSAAQRNADMSTGPGAIKTPEQNASKAESYSFLNIICARFLLAMFTRHSQRKESDKASSIQQHLRAIRHAENLDRQTHFRRSQVQRSFQRFDSTNSTSGSFALKAASSARNMLRQQQQSGNNCAIDEVTGARLLSVLAQLVGAQNTLRLGQKLELLCCSSPPQQDSSTAGGGYLPPLQFSNASSLKRVDLDKSLVHRRLALDFLKFLAQVVHDSMEELGASQMSFAELDAKQLQLSRPTSDDDQRQQVEVSLCKLALDAVSPSPSSSSSSSPDNKSLSRVHDYKDSKRNSMQEKENKDVEQPKLVRVVAENLSQALATDSAEVELVPVTSGVSCETRELSLQRANVGIECGKNLSVGNHQDATNLVTTRATEFVGISGSKLEDQDTERDPIEQVLDCIFGPARVLHAHQASSADRRRDSSNKANDNVEDVVGLDDDHGGGGFGGHISDSIHKLSRGRQHQRHKRRHFNNHIHHCSSSNDSANLDRPQPKTDDTNDSLIGQQPAALSVKVGSATASHHHHRHHHHHQHQHDKELVSGTRDALSDRDGVASGVQVAPYASSNFVSKTIGDLSATLPASLMSCNEVPINESKQQREETHTPDREHPRSLLSSRQDQFAGYRRSRRCGCPSPPSCWCNARNAATSYCCEGIAMGQPDNTTFNRQKSVSATDLDDGVNDNNSNNDNHHQQRGRRYCCWCYQPNSACTRVRARSSPKESHQHQRRHHHRQHQEQKQQRQALGG